MYLFIYFSALMAVSEIAKGVVYTDPIKTGYMWIVDTDYIYAL
jgi:hypothetical protein